MDNQQYILLDTIEKKLHKIQEGLNIIENGLHVAKHMSEDSIPVELPVILQLVGMLDEAIKMQREHLATVYVKNNENLYNKLSYRLEAFEQIRIWVNNKLSK